MENKIAIVTGATSGIGMETARGLAGKGLGVIMACRDVAKAVKLCKEIKAESGNNNVEVMKIDLASKKSIRKFAAEYLKKYDRLDVLINNAGLYSDRANKTEDGYELTIGVNYLGPFLLTRLLLPVIKKTQGARIINISSKAAYFAGLKLKKGFFTDGPHGFRAYAASKLAQVLFTIDLAEELADDGITVNAVHPGAVGTNIWKGSGILIKIVGPFMKRTSLSSAEGAVTGIYLATSPEVEGVTGKFFYECKVMKYNKASQNVQMRKKLMEMSFKEVL